MGLFKNPNASYDTKIAGIRANTSILGGVVPIVFGQQRVAGQLIDYGNFKASVQPQPGGKGIGANNDPTYNYTAAVDLLLCQGPTNGVGAIWASNGNLASAGVTETYTIPSGGGSYTVANASGFSVDQGVGSNTEYNQTVDDYGSPGSVTLSGTYVTPLTLVESAPEAGQYAQADGIYTFSASDAGKVVYISYQYDLQYVEAEEVYGVPDESPYQITVQEADYFNRNVSVVYYPSGTVLTHVGGSPATGQYTNSSEGVYTFSSGDEGQLILITYFYQDPNYDLLPTTQLNLTVFTGGLGQAPWGYLHGTSGIGYSECCHVASQEMVLGSDAEVPNYNFEVISTLQFGAGVVDTNPATAILALLTNPLYGVGFPEGNIDDWFTAQTSAFYWWAANSFFISQAITEQNTCAQLIDAWCKAGQVAPVFSEGLLKLLPYGDTSVAGNGYIYTAPTSPVVDLDDDDFLVDDSKNPEDPIKVATTDPQDIYTQTRIEWYPRIGNYNADVLTEDDPAAIFQYGFKPESPQTYDFIVTLPAAQFAINMRIRRNCYILNTYTFKLSWRYRYLEPMDLVTITDSRLGYSYLPVRITKREDSADDAEITLTCEDYPWGTQTATLYPKQFPPQGYVPVAGQQDPGQTSALIFEGTNRSQAQLGNFLYVSASSEDSNWGGCNVWVSTDGGDTYQQIAKINGAALVGELQTPLNVPPVTNATWVGGYGRNGAIITTMDIPNANNFEFPAETSFGISGWAVCGPTNSFAYASYYINGGSIVVVSDNRLPRTDVAAAYPGQAGSPNFGYYFTIDTASFTPGQVNTISVVVNDSAGNQATSTGTFIVLNSANVIMLSPNFDLTLVTSGNSSANLGALINTSGDVELIQWDAVSLIGEDYYTLEGVTRGALDSTIISHVVGEDFSVLSTSTIKYQYDSAFIGDTFYFKFPAFNQFGNRTQDLSQVTPVAYTVKGTSQGAIAIDTGIYQTGFGSSSVTFNPGFSYTATSSSITWFWNISVYQTNVALNVVTFISQQQITGLNPSTTYNFYPYVDWSVPGGQLTMVIEGGVGSPYTWAHIGDQLAWSQAQNQVNHNALSNGAMAAATVASGTGGGGTGGTGGGGAGSVSGAMWLTGLGSSSVTLNWNTTGAGSDTIQVSVSYYIEGTQTTTVLSNSDSGSYSVTDYFFSPYYTNVNFLLTDTSTNTILAGA